MRIIVALLAFALAGCLTWLLLIEAENVERRTVFWVMRVVARALLILTALMVAGFFFVGGPDLPRQGVHLALRWRLPAVT